MWLAGSMRSKRANQPHAEDETLPDFGDRVPVVWVVMADAKVTVMELLREELVLTPEPLILTPRWHRFGSALSFKWASYSTSDSRPFAWVPKAGGWHQFLAVITKREKGFTGRRNKEFQNSWPFECTRRLLGGSTEDSGDEEGEEWE